MHNEIIIRETQKRDLYAIAKLEADKYEYFGLSADAVSKKLGQELTCGVVALINEQVKGYAIYSLHKSEVEINNLVAVAEEIFTAFINKLKNLVNKGKRSLIYMNVQEDDLATLNLFKKNDFVCTKVEYDYFEDLKKDAFRMEYGQNKPKSKNGEEELVLV